VFGRRTNNLNSGENDQMKADQFRATHNQKFQDRYNIFEVIGQVNLMVMKLKLTFVERDLVQL